MQEREVTKQDMQKDLDQSKKAYQKPSVQIYGTIEKMTQNTGPKGAKDGGGGSAAGPKTGQ